MLALPPVFAKPLPSHTPFCPADNLCATVLIFYTLCSFFLYMRSRTRHGTQYGSFCTSGSTLTPSIIKLIDKLKSLGRVKPLFSTVLCFAGLVFSAFLWNRAAQYTEKTVQPIILPKDYVHNILFLAGTVILACYEEIVVRLFLPERAHCIALHLRQKRETAHKLQSMLYAAAEAIPIIVFALGHRYLGLYAALNAFTCAVILRVCMLVNERSLVPGCTAHILYNLTVFFILTH